MAMQTIVSRLTDPLDSALVTVTVFDAGGDADNVMADTARLMGQFHAVNKRTLEWIHGAIVKEATGTAEAHGCEAAVTFPPVLPDGITPSQDVKPSWRRGCHQNAKRRIMVYQ